jgi:hypothetical protein
MSTLPRIKINEYYDQFKPVTVTFTKEVIQVTGLLVQMVNLKCGSDFFPCVIYSTSFEAAKIVANNKSGIIDRLKEFNNAASLRFCFKIPSTEEQVAFLVPARIITSAPYSNSADMSVFTLQYSQRPPDDLIEIMGRILDANYCYTKRKGERFPMNVDALRKMRFVGNDIVVTTDGAANRCILRELCFGGARFIMKDAAEEIVNKPCTVKFEFDEPRESYTIAGKFVKVETAVSRADLAVLTVVYDDPVPMTYKTRLCAYINTLRTVTAAKPAAVTPPPAPPSDGEKPADEAAAAEDIAPVNDSEENPRAARTAKSVESGEK